MKKRRIQTGVLVAFALAMVASSAEAALVITTNMSAPTSQIMISQTNVTPGSSLSARNYTSVGSRKIGQQFQVPYDNATISAVSLLGSTVIGVKGSNVTINVYESLVATNIGSSVYSASSALPSSTISNGSWFTFDFDNMTGLTTNKYYTFTVEFPNQSSTTQGIAWARSTANPYPGTKGEWVYTNAVNGWESTANNNDFAFVVQIPEPGSIVLVALGGVLAMVIRKRGHA